MTDCVPVTVSRLLFTTMKRCQAGINPKRPTWKCKDAPVWGLFWEEQRDGDRVPAIFLCDKHKDEWTTGCEEAAA